MVENLKKTTPEQRKEYIRDAKYNLFKLKSDYVFIDLLTDSGTGAMSDKQWSEMMTGDESYAGARSFFKIKDKIKEIMGFDYVIPTHQGRGAENVLFSVLVKNGDIIPGNTHFDTTKGHIEFRHATAVDCTIDEIFDPTINHPFKGNIDLEKLEHVFKSVPIEKIPAVVVTITCNSGGGQPVSLENLKQVSAMCKKYNTLLLVDSARFAENAYFIKTREKGYENKTIKEIVREIYALADGAMMSSKKDAIVNIGGFIALKSEDIYKKACTFNIIYEGYITYGGMSGRDMAALAQGLDEGTEFDYLDTRINQVGYLGQKLTEYGVPVVKPFGGHAIYVDAKKFFPHIPQSEYPAQKLGVELYIEGGVRGVEIGTLLADRDPLTRENRYPKLELLRLAIPRRVYTNNHMNYTAACLSNIYERRDQFKRGFEIKYEALIMRHFTVELSPL